MDFTNWRRQTEKIPGSQLTEIYFKNAYQPNVFWVKNMSNADLYAAVNFVPNSKSYHKRILPYSDELIATPITSDRIFVYNNSPEEATIDIYSDKLSIFNYMLLKKNTESILQGVKDGLVLPVVDNNLKDAMPDGILKVQDINLLDSIASILSALAGGVNVSHDGLYKLANSISDNTVSVNQKPHGISVGTANAPLTFPNISAIHFVSNDGDEPITIQFDSSSFLLNPGEILNDIYNANISILKIGTESEIVNVRYIIGA